MKRSIQLACVWCGPLFIVLFLLGFLLLSKFIPPPPPTDTAEQMAFFFRSHTIQMRIGMVIVEIACSLVVPWTVVIAVQTGRIRGVPLVLPVLQVAAGALECLLGVMGSVFWLIAAFRPDELAPQTIRMLNDLAWMSFLMPSTPMTFWFAAIGIAILMDRDKTPIFPRWVGYVDLWAAVMVGGTLFIGVFKTGPLSWSGLLGLYMPLVAVAICFLINGVFAAKAINRDEQEDGDAAGSLRAPTPFVNT